MRLHSIYGSDSCRCSLESSRKQSTQERIFFGRWNLSRSTSGSLSLGTRVSSVSWTIRESISQNCSTSHERFLSKYRPNAKSSLSTTRMEKSRGGSHGNDCQLRGSFGWPESQWGA